MATARWRRRRRHLETELLAFSVVMGAVLGAIGVVYALGAGLAQIVGR